MHIDIPALAQTVKITTNDWQGSVQNATVRRGIHQGSVAQTCAVLPVLVPGLIIAVVCRP